ncbi:MAG: acyl-CoA thioesterase [Candidatus Marinimicrobia bacterium]|nr:acyl-CoA thioesterase [Candidatus Neomarinimicrobiota bacterium]MCF7903948.1 acyl-CoA thioesterase [Candidatus Neomarinimicrobiota bacterium]
MNTKSLEKYEKEYVVQASDIDMLGHVNNVVYVQWVQDIATEAWNATATPEQREKLFWVVAKHEIEYRRPAFENEVLVIRTWVGRAGEKLFTRFTDVVRKKDGKLIVKALTHWAPIDAQTLRPIKPGDDVYELFSALME